MCDTAHRYSRKMTMRSSPSKRLRTTGLWIKLLVRPASSVGSRMNSRIDSAMPSTTAVPMMMFLPFSSPKCRSIQRSILPGSSCSSSGRRSAEYVSACMPLTIESRNTTTPRMSGQPRIGCFSLTRCSSSTFSTSPSSVRQTMACFSGPRMRMPSMRACPPMDVRKETLVSGFADLVLLIWLPRLK